MKKHVFVAAVSAVACLLGAQVAQAGAVLDAVKKRGTLNCGVNTGLPGFSVADEKGKWKGLDVDVCRSVAAAVLGDANKVKYVPLTAKERFTALQSGEIDLLSRNTTWTLSRDASMGLAFAGVTYYDGQAFLVSKKLGIKSAKELNGASICIQSGTTTEVNVADYFRTNKMQYKTVVFDTQEQAIKAFEAGRCDVLTDDGSALYALRVQLKDPGSAMVLPEVISKEPLGPVVRQGDDEWFKTVRWALYAMVVAEELGVTSANVDQMKASNNPDVKRLLGVETVKQGMGLSDNWGYNVIKQVGNYSEVFERNIGQGSPLKIGRGLNSLWSKGGLQYAPPIM